jgi:hypothetical protein
MKCEVNVMAANAPISNLKGWLDRACSWLHEDGSQKVLQKPHQQLLGMMAQARDQNQAGRVWVLINELEKLALHMTDTREQGEVFINCAKMAADLEHLQDALRLFQVAESKYQSYPHQRAVALWMAGCIHWVFRQNVEGISAWQDAILLFKDRQLSVQVDSNKARWYLGILPELERALEQAIQMEGLPPADSDPPPTSSPQQNAPHVQDDPGEKDALRWLSCGISETVPAGGFGPVGYDPEPVGFLEVTEVMIDNKPHLIYSIHHVADRYNVVNLSPQHQYMTIHVQGTSMNAARPVPINDGDYVLVQSKSRPDNNDIIVVEIIGHDQRATVKRWMYDNGRIRLIPESTDQRHSEINLEAELGKLDGRLNIIGVVEAVFKYKKT